jgi:hypothetical protein
MHFLKMLEYLMAFLGSSGIWIPDAEHHDALAPEG